MSDRLTDQELAEAFDYARGSLRMTAALSELKERRAEVADLTAALDAALAGSVGNSTLIRVMQVRYGREARQWEANHGQRKQERDALESRVAKLERLLKDARRELGIVASYKDDPSIALGLKIRAKSCDAVCEFIDEECR